MLTVLASLHRLHPFQTRESQRLAVLFAVVYFAQGMWYLPSQPITIAFKDQGMSAGQVASFMSITVVPWLVKPVYGLLSDFVPLFGYRRRSYFIVTSALASLAAVAIVILPNGTAYWPLAILFTVMAFGLAFTDVITDAVMVENGRALNLTGALWQDEAFDRLVRGEREFGRICGYIERNPVSAGLAEWPEDYRWSSASGAFKSRG